MVDADSHPAASPLADPPRAFFYALRDRALSLAILVPALIVLGIAAWLTPDPSGVGTHQQLGLHACSTLAVTGYPCPTCGMTTAFAFAAHGQILAAFHAQPAGAFLALATACAALVSGYAFFVGLSLFRLADAFWSPRPLFILGGIVVAGWVYKIFTVPGSH